jgi:hypothetical protein
MIIDKNHVLEVISKNFDTKYDVSKLVYVNRSTKFLLGCKEHGFFLSSYTSISRPGEKCQKCRNKQKSIAYSGQKRENRLKFNLEDFLNACNSKHNSKYTYSKVLTYPGQHSSMIITCKVHDDFEMNVQKHLSGQGCPKCSGRNRTTEDIIKEFKAIHNDKFDYSKVSFINPYRKLIITCKEHGDFKQTYHQHIKKSAECPECKLNSNTLLVDRIIDRFQSVHGSKYDYSEVQQPASIQEKVTIICKKHGSFLQRVDNHFAGKGCRKCSSSISKFEESITSFVKTLDPSISTSNRKIIKNIHASELDIVSEKYKLAIECNGLHWHSSSIDNNRIKTYHLKKTNKTEEAGYQLIHIYEHNWNQKQEIVKSRLTNLFQQSISIGARKCTIKQLSTATAKAFFDKTHLQSHVNCKYYYGLFYNDEIVAAMSFSKRSILGNKQIELVRYSTKLFHTVIGGANKLLKHFIRLHKPDRIVSYADRSWSTGKLYEKLGFIRLHCTEPNYYYYKLSNKTLYHRYNFQKHKLFIENPLNLTEKQLMLQNGYKILYDSGSIKFELNLK